MRTISGRGGAIYLLGEPFRFTIPMRDCGDGWTWSSPGLRCWDQSDLSFEVWEGEWADLEPMELHPRFGRVTFSRCLRGESIKGSGTGRPVSALAAADWWQLELSAVVANRSVLGSSDVQTATKPTGAMVRVRTTYGVTGQVFVELPFGGAGVYVGIGNALPTALGAEITFDEEGVLYEPA